MDLPMDTPFYRSHSATEFLQGQHAAFRFLEQEEDGDSVWMSAHGHPKTEEYLRYRRIFDSLEYSSGIGARYLAFQNARNSVQFFAPKLQVSWAPANIPGMSGEYSPLRDRQSWTSYLRKMFEQRWPAGCEPSVYSGKWLIRTDVKNFYDDIRRTRDIQAELIEPGYWQLESVNPSEASMERMHYLIREYFAASPLPAPIRLWTTDVEEEPTTIPTLTRS